MIELRAVDSIHGEPDERSASSFCRRHRCWPPPPLLRPGRRFLQGRDQAGEGRRARSGCSQAPAGTSASPLGADGLLIVDDQFLPLAGQDQGRASKGISPDGKLAFVVNTHWHGDHTGGNRVFGKGRDDHRAEQRQEAPRGRAGTTRPDRGSRREALPVRHAFERRRDALVQRRGDRGRPRSARPHRRRCGRLLQEARTSCTWATSSSTGGSVHRRRSRSGDVAGSRLKNVCGTCSRGSPPTRKSFPATAPLGTVADLKQFQRDARRDDGAGQGGVAKGMTLEDAESRPPRGVEEPGPGASSPRRGWIGTLYTSMKR